MCQRLGTKRRRPEQPGIPCVAVPRHEPIKLRKSCAINGTKMPAQSPWKRTPIWPLIEPGSIGSMHGTTISIQAGLLDTIQD